MPHNRKLDTRLAKFHLICDNLPYVMAGSAVAAVALFFCLREEIPDAYLVPWFGFVIAWTVLRGVILRYWKKHKSTRHNVNQRIAVAAFLAFVMATSFGVFGFFAVDEGSPFSSLLILMILAGMTASATGSSSFLIPVYLFFVTPLLTPIIIKMWGFEDPIYRWLSALGVMFLFVCTGVSRSVSTSVGSSIRIRFENDELLENLRLEKQRAEEALKREAHANQAKSKFLAAASHDLRQPLHSLRLFTATLELQTRDTRHKTLVSQIDSSVKSLEELFNALLDISKLDAGTLPVNNQHSQLADLLRLLKRDFQPLAAEKGIEFVCEIREYVVYSDLLLLERLLRNIISNAIRYTSSGSVSLNVQLQGEDVSISVVDTGPGISASDQARIFEEFVQLNGNKHTRGQGIGLGLSIVKRLSILLDIPVSLVSKPGFGTTFSVLVPLGYNEYYEEVADAVSQPLHAVNSLFVLVVDDEYGVCLAVEGLLETWGCVVMTATSGDAALQQLKEINEIPDVILSDYRLRDGETGGDAIRRIREHLKLDVPAIILTGDIAPEQLTDIKRLGFPMLHKPCEPELLRKLIAEQANVLPLSETEQAS